MVSDGKKNDLNDNFYTLHVWKWEKKFIAANHIKRVTGNTGKNI